MPPRMLEVKLQSLWTLCFRRIILCNHHLSGLYGQDFKCTVDMLPLVAVSAWRRRHPQAGCRQWLLKTSLLKFDRRWLKVEGVWIWLLPREITQKPKRAKHSTELHRDMDG